MRRALSILTAGLFLASVRAADDDAGWFPFDPPKDNFGESAIDLRSLNEKFAGEHGFIATKGDEFVFSGNQQPVRFWAVNGPPHEASAEGLKTTARRLAKYGVNLCRLHGGIFGDSGKADPKRIEITQEIIEALKGEGVYAHLSIYFPLWMTPKPDHPYLKGYDGQTHPFAALMFNPDFQREYREWWKALLLTPNPKTTKRLIDEPAVFGVEIQNEDSFFFWTFDANRLPDTQLRILETQFADWLKKKYGSLDGAFAKWNNLKTPRDNASENRVSFRPLWNTFSEKTPRDRDTAAFLFETQRRFYAETYAFLRSLGFKGLITASNWATASPEVFGPLEKWSYTATDFIDRHGYFGVTHKGAESAWSIRNGHTYNDRSALRFDAETPGKPKQFVHPSMDPTYDNKPSMISETTWNRPNRYRSEAPVYFAAYGALQGSDAIVHFAFDGDHWSVKPNYWMQPWTLMAPSQVAQFPAAALMYRRGLIKEGEKLATINLNTNDLLNLKGTPLPQDASLDELRLKDLPATGADLKPGQRIDPLIHYAGRVDVNFNGAQAKTELKDLSKLIDHANEQVRSSTGELLLDYKTGLLTINSPKAQGASGNLKNGAIKLSDITVESPLDNAHVLLVALDDTPLANSKRMLLQVMTEEKATGFATEDAGNGVKKIVEIGHDPWRVKRIEGSVEFKKGAKIQPLDFNGYPKGNAISASDLKLLPETIYYFVTR